MTIKVLFENQIDRPIEEVIKVGQENEKAVKTEIAEYVVTDSIGSQYTDVYKEIAEGAASPREGIGVWVSGFFGSGKSSFAKILGYTVANRCVGETSASSMFKKVLKDTHIADLLDSINQRIPFETVIFDVSMDSGVRPGNDRLTEIMYRALLRQLGYAEDFDLAELEITLEADDRLEHFEQQFLAVHKKSWRQRRQLGLAINEAGAVLHAMEPKTYPTADSYAIATGKGRADVDPNKLARRAFDLTARRLPGKALIFIVDEVGQYVSRSVDKMLDLQAIVQAIGVEGRNRTEKKQAVSPFWVVVTSQEKLNEVVTALDSKKIELARLQDRFRINVDLKQADIAEITAKRILRKKKEAEARLQTMFDTHAGRIKECCTLERTARNLEINRAEFVKLYPYLPYQVELSIDIVAGLRMKRGAHKHVGGSNRTIIKQAQQMMINDRTRMADQPVGTLVTLDKVYELLEVGNLLPSEVQTEINHVKSRLSGNEIATKVVKTIALLEAVKDLPRTAHNIAVMLHPAVDAPSQLSVVAQALAELERAQFVRNTEDGYKLLTVQEKNWETRRNEMEPREADRNRISREVIKDVFSEANIRTHRYKELRSFRFASAVNGETLESDGDLQLQLFLAEGVEKKRTMEEARTESASRQNELFWVVSLQDVLRDAMTELFRSREMVAEYERLASQNRLTSEEGVCLAEEKTRRDTHLRTVKRLMVESIRQGTLFFQGTSYEVALLGNDLSAMMRAAMEKVVPVLYPKLEIGVLPLSDTETQAFLTAANLNGLSKVFYSDKEEQALVIKQGDQYVPNLTCDLCRELLEYLRREHAYGNKVTGKMLESNFGGVGYGFNLESIRLGLAVLFRGGALEISHQGRKYGQYNEPSARQPFINTPAFRSASFSPRVALDLKVLAQAARLYEDITGKEVAVEAGAISQAINRVAIEERDSIIPLRATLKALNLPGLQMVDEQLEWMEELLGSDPDDCVKLLATEGKTYLSNRTAIKKLALAATDVNVATMQSAGRVLREQWTILQKITVDEDLLKTANRIRALLDSEECLMCVSELKELTSVLSAAYQQVYLSTFEKRRSVYREAAEDVKGRPEWMMVTDDPAVTHEQRENLLLPLAGRAEAEADFQSGDSVCRQTRATLAQLESDIQAIDAVKKQVVAKLMELSVPDEKIERIVVSKVFSGRIASEQELQNFLKVLQERMEKSLAQGNSIIIE